MARSLSSDKYPLGHDLGNILEAIRAEVLKGSGRIAHDGRPETRHLLGHVLDCNMNVLGMLSEARKAAEVFVGVPLQRLPEPVPYQNMNEPTDPCRPPRRVG